MQCGAGNQYFGVGSPISRYIKYNHVDLDCCHMCQTGILSMSELITFVHLFTFYADYYI